MDDSTLARFWSKVDRNGPVPAHNPSLGNCWVWTASKNAKGYGYFRADGVNTKAHKVSAEIHGVKGLGPYTLHHCDNPSCVRPNHLYYGTTADNMIDKCLRGKSGQKLTRDIAERIRADRARGLVPGELCGKYGVSKNTVNRIIRRKIWAW